MAQTKYTQIELLSAKGPVYRRVSTAPPRTPTEDEIPIIDLSPIDGTLEMQKELASRIRAAAKNTGFFYITNHGIPEELIQKALAQAKAFFGQSEEEKQRVSNREAGRAGGFQGVGSTQVNKTETRGISDIIYPFHRREKEP